MCFLVQVHKTKEQFGQEGPITIHCSAGVGRSGVFITLSIALERMRYEGVVDMFQVHFNSILTRALIEIWNIQGVLHTVLHNSQFHPISENFGINQNEPLKIILAFKLQIDSNDTNITIYIIFSNRPSRCSVPKDQRWSRQKISTSSVTGLHLNILGLLITTQQTLEHKLFLKSVKINNINAKSLQTQIKIFRCRS